MLVTGLRAAALLALRAGLLFTRDAAVAPATNSARPRVFDGLASGAAATSPFVVLTTRLAGVPTFTGRGSNSNPVVPSGFLTRKAETCRRVRCEPNPRLTPVRPSLSSFAI